MIALWYNERIGGYMSNLFPCIASEFDLRNQVAKEFFPKFHTIIENNRVDFLVSSDKSQLYKQDLGREQTGQHSYRNHVCPTLAYR